MTERKPSSAPLRTLVVALAVVGLVGLIAIAVVVVIGLMAPNRAALMEGIGLLAPTVSTTATAPIIAGEGRITDHLQRQDPGAPATAVTTTITTATAPIIAGEGRITDHLQRQDPGAPATAVTTTITTAAAPTTPTSYARRERECSLEEAMPRVMESVAQVVTDDGSGTAFYMGDVFGYGGGQFVTAAHVVYDSDTVTLLTPLGQLAAEVLGYDTTVDVAYLQVYPQARWSSMPGLEWADTTDLDPGAQVAVVGFPTGVTGVASVTTGRLSRIAAYPGNITFLQTDAAANPGNSGGPLINACGDVVGLVISKLVGIQIEGIAYAVAAATVEDTRTYLMGHEGPSRLIHDWRPETTACLTPEETDWLWDVGRVMDRLDYLSRDFAELLNIAVAEDWALVENDPTWKQAAIIAAFRFDDPARQLLDLLPAPGDLRESARDLEAVARIFTRLADDLPGAIQTNNGGARNAALDRFPERKEPWARWINTIFDHCQA